MTERRPTYHVTPSTLQQSSLEHALFDASAKKADAAIPLREWVEVRRRYSRSINLERDLSAPGSVDGYVMTPRALEALERLAEAFAGRKGSRAFTLTGVYGTGKSAFAHFFLGLIAASDNAVSAEARKVLSQQSKDPSLLRSFRRLGSGRGLVRAVATARQESVTSVIARAIGRGAREYFAKGRVPAVALQAMKIEQQANLGRRVDRQAVLSTISGLADASSTGLVIVLDELGKVLEHAAASSAGEDLYLLQQIAEMPESSKGVPIVLIGMLHQTFGEYASSLAITQRTEWQKVQGRFEDIAFGDAPDYMVSLISSAISHERTPPSAQKRFHALGPAWQAFFERQLEDGFVRRVLRPNIVANVAPLHPIAALILPMLCAKYAQHDRSLFAFLSSNEAHSFGRFLLENNAHSQPLPLYLPSGLYDYFVDVAGSNVAFKPQFQRWAEIQGAVAEARSLDPDSRAALKTIAILNLIANSGPYKASRALVIAALVNSPDDESEISRWNRVLDELESKRYVSYRRSLDEYRMWEGSEFDTDAAVQNQIKLEARPLAALLNECAPLPALVAQRHSYATGTLRYFERAYVDLPSLGTPDCRSPFSDGLLLYWVGTEVPPQVPAHTPDGRPVVLLVPESVKSLRARAEELVALKQVLRMPQLQSDGVARRDVAARIDLASKELEKANRDAFEPTRTKIIVEGRRRALGHAALNAHLSELCDRTYTNGIVLLNELVNRRELTSAGARARREVIEAMILRGDTPRLGFRGNGPEASVYESVLARTGIHRQRGGRWTFGPPNDKGILPLWTAIEEFCIQSQTPRSVDQLLRALDRPPYGTKRGVVPIIIAAVWLYHVDDVSVYHEGRFLPVLGPEHFELIVKHPAQFAVKHFEISGLRWQLLREMEEVIVNSAAAPQPSAPVRSASLLAVLRPLIRFVQSLPQYTLKNSKLSPEAIAVREALLHAREPDELLFRILPNACGCAAFDVTKEVPAERTASFRRRLSEVLKELATAYERLLERCLALIHKAFAVAGDNPATVRQDLRVRGQYLAGRVIDPTMQAVVGASINDAASDREWIEALITVIAERPADVWTDEDAFAFEFRVTDIARRLANLWALVQEASATGRDGFDARRLTVTRSDGQEAHKLVWVDHSVRDLIEQVSRDALSKVQHFPREQQFAVAALIAEAVFAADASDSSIAPTLSVNPAAHEPGAEVGRRNRTGRKAAL